jgi:hypothetical protein
MRHHGYMAIKSLRPKLASLHVLVYHRWCVKGLTRLVGGLSQQKVIKGQGAPPASQMVQSWWHWLQYRVECAMCNVHCGDQVVWRQRPAHRKLFTQGVITPQAWTKEMEKSCRTAKHSSYKADSNPWPRSVWPDHWPLGFHGSYPPTGVLLISLGKECSVSCLICKIFDADMIACRVYFS